MPVTETDGDTTATTRTYDPQRLWTERILHAKPVGPALADLNYVWSPEGELTSRDDATADPGAPAFHARRRRSNDHHAIFHPSAQRA